MLILTDVDGVLLDWFGSFKEYVKEQKIPTKCDTPTDYKLSSWLDHGHVAKVIEAFNTSPAFEFVPAYHDAIAVLPKLVGLGHDFVAITSCTDDPASVAMRKRNLESFFGPIFKEIICLPLGVSKLESLRKYNPGAWWIEDKPEGAQEGLTAGHKAILMTREYNENFNHEEHGIHRSPDWYEIYGKIMMK